MTIQSYQTTPYSEEKHDAILTHAIEVFADEGFRRADVQVIADRAGVGKGTVYRYFGNKEDLFWATTYSVLERLREHVFTAMEGVTGTLQTLQTAGRAYAGFFDANPQYLEIFVQNRAEFRGSAPQSHKQFHENMINVFTEILEKGIGGGEVRPVDARKTIISLASVLYGTVVFGCYVKEVDTLNQLAEQTLGIFLEGIRAK
jgi:AcrR family transcriptional regulator